MRDDSSTDVDELKAKLASTKETLQREMEVREEVLWTNVIHKVTKDMHLTSVYSLSVSMIQIFPSYFP